MRRNVDSIFKKFWELATFQKETMAIIWIVSEIGYFISASRSTRQERLPETVADGKAEMNLFKTWSITYVYLKLVIIFTIIFQTSTVIIDSPKMIQICKRDLKLNQASLKPKMEAVDNYVQ